MNSHNISDAEKEIYAEIRKAIAERRLLPGKKLTEEAIARLFDVSRARVRKILLILAKEHMVTLQPNKGAYVWKPTAEESRKILDARTLVELYLVEQATVFASKKQLNLLQRIIDDERAALAKNDRAAVMRLSGDFHIALGKCGNNPFLQEFLESLISQSYLILATYQIRDGSSCPQTDHADILARVAARDAKGAVEILSRHFSHIEADLDLVDLDEPAVDLSEILRR
ncbi:MAG: GntR family transcriptional regulator [Rhodobacteraceae bacterium]|nr:GntR family transcriptional regulator [Paracoccaceae bacterium]